MYIVCVLGNPQELSDSGDNILCNSSTPTIFNSLDQAEALAEYTLHLSQTAYKNCNWGIAEYGYTIHKILTDVVKERKTK